MQNNDLLIAAQNRTTHAVRALAIFIIYSSISSLVGGVIIGISYAVAMNSYEGLYSAGGGIIFGALVAAVGYLVALSLAAAELGKSKPQKTDGSKSTEDSIPFAKGWDSESK